MELYMVVRTKQLRKYRMFSYMYLTEFADRLHFLFLTNFSLHTNMRPTQKPKIFAIVQICVFISMRNWRRLVYIWVIHCHRMNSTFTLFTLHLMWSNLYVHDGKWGKLGTRKIWHIRCEYSNWNLSQAILHSLNEIIFSIMYVCVCGFFPLS